MLVLGGQPSWKVTTRITALLNINILGNNKKKKYDREHAVIRKDGVAKSLYRNDNIDFRAVGLLARHKRLNKVIL